MSLNRRDFLGFLAAGTAAGALEPGAFSTEVVAGVPPKDHQAEMGVSAMPSIKALAFDAYGTLFDVNSVAALGEA